MPSPYYKIFSGSAFQLQSQIIDKECTLACTPFTKIILKEICTINDISLQDAFQIKDLAAGIFFLKIWNHKQRGTFCPLTLPSH